MRIKHLVTLLALLLLVVVGVAAQDDEEMELPDLGGETITIAIENAYPPFNYLDEDGTPIGWDYDVVRELCARLNCVPEFVETSWDGMILAVSQGEFDMAADGITITEERAEVVDFSQGYVTLEQVLLASAEEDRFTTVEEFLEGDFTIGVQPGTTNFFVAQDLLGEDSDRIITFRTFPIAVQAVIAGEVDAAIMDDVAGQGYVGANPDDVMIVGESLTAQEELGFIFPQGSELRDAIDSGLQSMEADGSLLEFNLKWFAGTEDEAEVVELPDLGGETITIAIENAYPPFNYLDEDGTPIGWDYDVVRELCTRLNCVPEFVETSWDGMILAVSQGEFDMAADGITITEERAEVVDFSQGYVTLEQVLLASAEEDRFTTVEEFLEGDFTIGVQPGTTNFFVAQDLLGEDSDRIITFRTFPIAVQAVIAGEVDAAIMDDVAGQGYVGANPDDVMIVGESLTAQEELGFIFPQGSELRDAINAGLQSMEADGSLLDFNLKWFTGTDDEEGEEMDDMEMEEEATEEAEG